MDIRTYNSAQLYSLILSDAFKHMPVIPISTHRAISHIHNPRTDKEDILMAIAYENDVMVGYLGVLADRIYPLNGEAYKCGWLSCMWVDPTLRGKGIAKLLLATVFNTWDDRILVTEFTPEAKGLYDRSGNFADLRTSNGLRCYMRFNLHEVIPKKNDRYKSYTSGLKLIDDIANSPIDLLHSLIKTKIAPSIQFTQLAEIDEDLDRYIQSKMNGQFERRTAADINWIIQYPWLKESKPTQESSRYHFSSVSDRFQNLWFKLIDKGEIKGFIHFSIRDNHLKIPYLYFEDAYLKEVVSHIYQIMLGYKLNMLTVFHTKLVDHFNQQPTLFLYKRPIKRNYIITKALDSHFNEKEKLLIQDGDADCAFT